MSKPSAVLSLSPHYSGTAGERVEEHGWWYSQGEDRPRGGEAGQVEKVLRHRAGHEEERKEEVNIQL